MSVVSILNKDNITNCVVFTLDDVPIFIKGYIHKMAVIIVGLPAQKSYGQMKQMKVVQGNPSEKDPKISPDRFWKNQAIESAEQIVFLDDNGRISHLYHVQQEDYSRLPMPVVSFDPLNHFLEEVEKTHDYNLSAMVQLYQDPSVFKGSISHKQWGNVANQMLLEYQQSKTPTHKISIKRSLVDSLHKISKGHADVHDHIETMQQNIQKMSELRKVEPKPVSPEHQFIKPIIPDKTQRKNMYSRHPIDILEQSQQKMFKRMDELSTQSQFQQLNPAIQVQQSQVQTQKSSQQTVEKSLQQVRKIKRRDYQDQRGRSVEGYSQNTLQDMDQYYQQ